MKLRTLHKINETESIDNGYESIYLGTPKLDKSKASAQKFKYKFVFVF